ncbi:MAG: TIGR02117 family protein [Sphingomonadaceae bacterium]|nr:MAG: TIGR02117 family protein [Sphingomonadaceae bacterium]
MPRRKKQSRISQVARILAAIILIPLASFIGLAALGSVIPVNTAWEEPEEGVTIYLADNGVHLDIVFPVEAAGVEWRPLFQPTDIADPRWYDAGWVMIGAGDRGIYTTAKDWADLKPGVALDSMVSGDRVMHVQWVTRPHAWTAAELRLTKAQYRRLFAAARETFALQENGSAQRLGVDGYFGSDAFYEGKGPFNLVQTCNQWVAERLRIAGVETSLWSPFSVGLPWRYREPGAP